MTSPLTIEIEAARELNLAMVENADPLVARLSLTNTGATELTSITVEAALLPDFSAKWSAHVAAIPPGGTFHVDAFELPLDRARLLNQLERCRGDLAIWVRAEGSTEPLATHSQRVDVLAYNEWSPLSVPQLLAAFVLPNHPAIAELLGAARAPLERLTGDPALDGYQAGDGRRVAAIAQAVYETFQARGITYSNPPASFETVGQKIRTPEQVVGDQLATCLDITVTVAACLEQVGLHPVAVLIQGHAFPGVWLHNFYVPEALIDDAATVRKLVELDRLLIFDSSSAVTRPAVPFAEARRKAFESLEHKPLRHLLDIKGARQQHYRPLPLRVTSEYGTVVEVQVPVPSGPASVPRVAPADNSARSRSARTRHPRVEAWKQRLLDTSLRNRLMNFRDTKQSLELLCADLGTVEDALASGEELRLRPRPSLLGGDDPRSRRLLEARVAEDAVKAFLSERLQHCELHSSDASETTATKLTTIFRAAREALEETGTNALCMTFGMLHWYESPTSEQPRRAPILLVPVALVRNARGESFTVKASGEDARLNVTLFEKLRIDTGITVPELSELPLDQAGVDVPAVLRIVREAVLNLPRWEVKNDLHLGLFSFAKFQMWADLDQNVDALLENPIVQHLLSGKGEVYPNQGAFPEPHQLDGNRSPKDLVCPLDADASQLAAVAAAADGKTFVLQGPPGTGKSQTITNLIAHCMTLGKRVLFVAEKAAALEVVQRRLTQIGLAPYVLELHSHKSGKQQVLDQFRLALETPAGAEPLGWDMDTRRLVEERGMLNTYVAALHRPRGGDLTVFKAFARLSRLRGAPLYVLPAHLAESPEQYEGLQRQVEALRDALKAIGPASKSPWQNCQIPRWEFDLPARVEALLQQATQRLDATERAAGALAASLGAAPPVTLGDLESLCQVGQTLVQAPAVGDALRNPVDWEGTLRDAKDVAESARARTTALALLDNRYQPALFDLDLDGISARLQKLAHAFFLFAWWGIRNVKKTVRKVSRDGRLRSRDEIVTDLDRARMARDAERRLTAADPRARTLYGDLWNGPATAPGALEGALAWSESLQLVRKRARPGFLAARLEPRPEIAPALANTMAQTAELRSTLEELARLLGTDQTTESGPSEDLRAIRERLGHRHADVGHLRDWYGFLTSSGALAQAGCGALVEASARGDLNPDALAAAFERGVVQAWARQALADEPDLNTFDGEKHSRRVEGFAVLDRKLLGSSAVHARSVVSARVPALAGSVTGGEMGVLQKELQKKRRHMPIRKLLAEIPSLATRLKPCFLMSPMSVATYLDPRAAKFDLVLFDEASQIPTHDAVGVFARGRSAVVVGDSKQLPPTSFFQSGGDDDTPQDGDFEELESVLDECIASGLPERRLDWHYRSRHESLIAFSNFHYYKNRLNTFPSALAIAPGRGVSLCMVTGFYDKGGARTNRAEADAVVADVVGRLRAPGARARSYGVVTFSMAQQGLVEDLLDRARTQYPEIEVFFGSDCAEPVIVKNLENIQGDERDVMIFSICYGPDQNGVVSMNFGPMNRVGGERRLNVAVTRAREELVVYSTLAPEQIDLTRTQAVGVKHLKTFLDYARRGPVAISEALTVQGADSFDSPFEEQVCERLRALGFTVHTQVGCAGYRIDMGICDAAEPGRYLLGVECDGAHYHSARSARERDRLRGQVLEGLGWRIHRIWSTDWWQSPEREVEKVKAALEQARLAPRQVVPVPAPPEPAALATRSLASAPRGTVARSASQKHEVPAQRGLSAQAAEPALQLVAHGPAAPPAIVPYRVAEVPEGRRSVDDIHDDQFREELRQLLQLVIGVEAPLSLRVLARRVSPFYRIQRTSNRLEERLRTVLGRTVNIKDDIVWRVDQDPAAYSEVRLAPAEARREAQEVPLEEVANAAATVLRSSIASEEDELVKLTARALGFTRTGDRVAEHVAAGLALLVKTGRARREGTKVVCV